MNPIIEIAMDDAFANYQTLSEQEKELIRNAMNGPLRAVIAKVFGAEFDQALGQFATAEPAPRRGLAAR
jgi:hypothetical protein